MSPRYLAAGWLALCSLVPFSNSQAALDADLMKGLTARAIGPASISGRVAALDAVAADPNHIVVGAATGGVWISHNGGLNWTPVFDDMPVASIGAVAINQSNPDVIWVGTGEGNVRNSTSIGGGLYKSVDGGKSWTLVGLENSERINRIALHPTDANIVYVAAMGTLWGENAERGVYKSIDGGQNWTRVLYVDETTGATDVKIDPHNPDKIFAAMWQFRRWPYQFKSGGPGSGMYLSWDGGNNWQQKTEEDGLPEGEHGRMVIAPSPAQANRVYALVEAEKSALVRSDDGGRSWSRVNEDYNIVDRPFYYTELTADPENPDRLYNIATRLRVSIDGGRNFEYNSVIDCCAASNTIHIDSHAFWINPQDPRHLIIGNDGGIGISRDRGETWRFVRNLPLAQFYHVAVDDDHPYNVYGGLQDNGSWRGPSEVWENGGIRNLHWREVGFGDGFDTIPDPQDSTRGYSMSQGGFLYRWNLGNGELRLIRPSPQTPDTDLRFNWSAGFAVDPFDPATIYYGSQFLHRSTDRGESWTAISGDLTSNNPAFQTFRDSGGLTPDVTAAENYTSIISVAPSPLDRGTIWVGSDDGRIHVTLDAGQNWQRIDERAPRAVHGAWVAMIHPSSHDGGTAFVVFDDHRRSNMTTHAFRVDDHGRKWTRLEGDALSGYALSILEDPVDPNLLFLGTEFGLFVSTDAGKDWTKFTAGVPTVSVMDMAIQARETDLVLGTHGRAVYVIDDYAALRGLSAADFSARLRILDTTDAQQYDPVQTPSTRFTGSGEFRADNEPYGVMVTFMASGDDLVHPDDEAERKRQIDWRHRAQADDSETEGEKAKKDDDPAKVELRVFDAQDQQIRFLKLPLTQGINRVVWGLERDGVRPMPGPEPAELDDGLPGGPEVVPGDYRITLSFDGIEQSASVRVLADPRSSHSIEDQRARFALEVELMHVREAVVTAVERIVHAREDVNFLTGMIEKRGDAETDKVLKALVEQADEVNKALDDMEKRFRTPPRTKGIVFDDDKVANQLGLAQFYVGSSFGAPTPAARVYVDNARAVVEAGIQSVNDYLDGELKAFREQVEQAGIGLLKAEPVSL